MNVEIGAEAELFSEKEYINGIAVAVYGTLYCTCTVIDTDINQTNGSINQYIGLKETVHGKYGQKNISLFSTWAASKLNFSFLKLSFKCALSKRGFESELSG